MIYYLNSFNKSLEINSPGYEKLRAPDKVLNAGNSGTTIRLLSGVLASLPFKSIITGDDSLKRRPMKRIIEPLEAMGARIKSDNYCPPIEITGNELKPIDYNLEIPSAQVKSAIILAALNTRGTTFIHEKIRTRDHTERMVSMFGANLIGIKNKLGTKIEITGKHELKRSIIDIPSDFSSAAFFIALSLLVPDSRVIIENVSLNSTRLGFLKIFQRSGLLKISDFEIFSGEPQGKISVHSGRIEPIVIEKEEIPILIDEIPILSVIATQLDGVSIIKNAGELRVKESNRIQAIQENIQNMGGQIEINDKDDIIIKGPTPLSGTKISTYGDHRICMAFTIAGLIAEGETIITDPESVDYSFPGFFDVVDSLF